MANPILINVQLPGAQESLDTMKNLRVEINALVAANRQLAQAQNVNTAAIEANNVVLTARRQQYQQLNRTLSQSVAPLTALSTATQTVTNNTNGMRNAFQVATQTLNVMGTTASQTIRQMMQQRFPNIGQMAQRELSILTTAYQQAQQIGSNSFDMQALAMNAFRGDLQQVTLAVNAYQQLLQNNSGADAVALNTAAFIALRSQVETAGYSVRNLNNQINQAAININALPAAGQSINKLQADIDGVTNKLRDIPSSANLTSSIRQVFVDTSIKAVQLTDKLISLNRTIKDGITTASGYPPLITPAQQAQIDSYKSSINGLTMQIELIEQQYRGLSKSQRTFFDPTQLNSLRTQLSQAQSQIGGFATAAGRARTSGFDPLNNSIMQMAREMPNFAISWRIGIMSISNNLPIMVDAINSARIANQRLIESNNLVATTGVGTMQTVIPVWKQALKSLVGINGVISLITLGIVLLTNTKVLNWFKDLLNITDKVVNKFDHFDIATQELIKTTSEYSGTASNTIKNITKLGLELDKFGGNAEYADTIVKEFNQTFNTHLKTIEDVKEAYPEMAKSFIENAIRMQAAMSLIDKSSNAMLDAQNARLQISGFNKKDLNDAYNIGKQLEEFAVKAGYSQAEIAKGLEKGEGFEAIFNNMKKLMAMDTGGGKSFEEQTYMSKFYSTYKNFEDIQGGNVIVKVLAQLSKAKKEMFLYNNEAKKLLTPPTIKKDKEKKDKAYNPESIKDTPEVVYAELVNREIIKWTEWKNAKLTNLEEEQINISNERANSRILEDSVFKQLDYDARLLVASMTDVIDETDLWNSKLDAAKNKKTLFEKSTEDLNKLYDAQQKQNNLLADEENALNKLEIKLKEAEKIREKSKNKTEADKYYLATIKPIEQEIEMTKQSIQERKDYIIEVKRQVDEQKEKIKTLTEGTKEYEEAQKQLQELEKKRANILESQHDLEVKRWREKINLSLEYMNAIKSVGSGISDMAQGSMDMTNKEYDAKIWANDEIVQSDTAREQNAYRLEMERYEALKENFEMQKTMKEAMAWMDFASGSISLWTTAMELGPIAGPIMGAIQQAALLATTIGNVQSIRAQTLDKPHRPGGGSGGSSGANIALNPAKDALTSKEENLNMMNKSNLERQNAPTVKVSDINKVQNKVKVREQNTSY